MNAGKKNRIGRFLKPDGRSLIVAFDHGVFRGPTQGSEKPERVFEQIIEGGADGVLVTPGLATKFSDILSGRIGVILSVPMDPLYVDPSTDFLKCLARAYEEVTGEKAEFKAIGGTTYAKAVPNAVSFGPLFPGEEELAHQPNERISINSLVKMSEVYAAAIYYIAGY